MSDTERSLQDFLQRWSRRKLASEEHLTDKPGPLTEPAGRSAPSSPVDALADGATEAFDPTNLPAIESIDAATDIRAFLARGVPTELTRAALRRAWVSDPAIRDFIGLAENQWDFTKPDTVPGFGSLELTPELRTMVARLVGEPSAKDERTAHTKPAGERIVETSGKTLVPDPAANSTRASSPSALRQSSGVNAASQNDITVREPAPVKWKHGGALPK